MLAPPPPPVQALAGQKVAVIESGWKHSLAVTEAGGFYSWGRNVNGQVCWGEGAGRQAGVEWVWGCGT